MTIIIAKNHNDDDYQNIFAKQFTSNVVKLTILIAHNEENSGKLRATQLESR